ncbi:MAG: ribonuclease / adenosylcobalamin/alpha-ribazole phosphatase [Actinomycetota bacterium]
MTLFLARHGRTAANASGLLLGRADAELDDVGRAQAAALGSLVPSPARVVSSPLTRCRETAAAFGVPVEVDERWIELDYGEWDEQPIIAIPAEVWARWRTDLDLRPPGGETLRELGTRVRAACDSLLDDARDADVVVVSHVSPLKAALAWTLDVGDELAWRLHVTPASVSRVAIRPQGPVLLSFNETAHLPA